MKTTSKAIFRITAFFICLFCYVEGNDKYISIDKNCKFVQEALQNNTANYKKSDINKNFFLLFKDIEFTVKFQNITDGLYAIGINFIGHQKFGNITLPLNKYEFNIRNSQNDLLTIRIIQPRSQENLYLEIFDSKNNICKYRMKRIFWRSQTEYDFTLESISRKEALEFGLYIFYKNKTEFLNKISKHLSIVNLDGLIKTGKTFITKKLADNSLIAEDPSINTVGFCGIINQNNALIIDKQGLDTQESSSLFKISKIFTKSDMENPELVNILLEEEQEKNRNNLFHEILQDAFRIQANIAILMQNQLSIFSQNYLEDVIEKYLSFSEIEKVRIFAIHNYKDFNYPIKVQTKINNDIINRHRVFAYETNGKQNSEVKVYDDLYYKYYSNSKIRLTYAVLGRQGEKSGDYFNFETLDYIKAQALDNKLDKIFNPIEQFVENINNFARQLIYSSGKISDQDLEILKTLRCAKLENNSVNLENFKTSTLLNLSGDLDRIVFNSDPLCLSIWDAKLKTSQKITYEIYQELSTLNINIFLPFVNSLNQIKLKDLEFRKNNIGNIHYIIIKGEINYLKGNNNFGRRDFIRHNRIKSFIINEAISLGYSFLKNSISNICDYVLQNGMLNIKCPII